MTPLALSLLVFALMFALWRWYSHGDPLIPVVRVRLDTVALCFTCIGLLLLTVIALWK